jgi:hypothetical protein
MDALAMYYLRKDALLNNGRSAKHDSRLVIWVHMHSGTCPVVRCSQESDLYRGLPRSTIFQHLQLPEVLMLFRVRHIRPGIDAPLWASRYVI